MLSARSLLKDSFAHPPAKRPTRWVIRATLLALGHRVEGVIGGERLRRLEGPFVAVLNHSQRTEAFLVPALLAWLRGGRVLRFLADWNFMLVPPVYALYRSARVIPVTRKPARPRWLTPLRRWIAPPPTGFAAARQCLQRGTPVGCFVEGTINRHPRRLLRGQRGAARLSLITQVPVLPVGVQFPYHADPAQPIAEREPLSLHIGPALHPPTDAKNIKRVDAWHATIMRALARQSGTVWAPGAQPRAHPAPLSPA
ncbi:lysophospholipid acyltransferase family protein [Salisaeta longa]|uniref:lysophospholipid acyltransferase family protein n=1 Tax=Salisaeta longa TaxID=503170 RepID=UPI0003B412D8|nr:lysophospholipid acyltransferase family protein [Salisaeta longa]